MPRPSVATQAPPTPPTWLTTAPPAGGAHAAWGFAGASGGVFVRGMEQNGRQIHGSVFYAHNQPRGLGEVPCARGGLIHQVRAVLRGLISELPCCSDGAVCVVRGVCVSTCGVRRQLWGTASSIEVPVRSPLSQHSALAVASVTNGADTPNRTGRGQPLPQRNGEVSATPRRGHSWRLRGEVTYPPRALRRSVGGVFLDLRCQGHLPESRRACVGPTTHASTCMPPPAPLAALTRRATQCQQIRCLCPWSCQVLLAAEATSRPQSRSRRPLPRRRAPAAAAAVGSRASTAGTSAVLPRRTGAAGRAQGRAGGAPPWPRG